MSFAAGMRAGQLAVEGAIDQYKDAKRSREMRDVEKELAAMQQASAERQYGIDRASATTGLGAQQQRQAVMPQAPSATGLSLQEQAAMVAPGVPGRTAPAPSVTGLSMEQQAGLMQEPRRPSGEYVPMSQQAIEELRADRLRGLGYDEDADRAMGRAMALRQEQREIEQTGFERGVTGRQEERADTRLAMEQDKFKLTEKLTNLNIDTAQMNLDSLKAVDAAYESFSNYDGDLGGYMETPEWKALDQRGREALVQSQTGLAANLQKLGTMNIQNELRKANDLPSMVTAVNGLSATDGLDIRATVDEETNKVTLSSVYNDEDADNYQQERGKPKTFDSPEEAMRYIAEMAQDPILGADNFINREKAAAAAVAKAQQQGIENLQGFVDTRVSVIESLVGDIQSYYELDEADRQVLDGKIAEIMGPLTTSLGIGGEQMGGMPDAGDDLRTGGPGLGVKEPAESPSVNPYQGQIDSAVAFEDKYLTIPNFPTGYGERSRPLGK